MSDLIEAILLGIIQGLTEFLPVSSSGHLELAKVMFGYDKSAEESMLLTVILHAATALSTMVIFRKEIIEIITGLVSFDKEQVDFSGKIIRLNFLAKKKSGQKGDIAIDDIRIYEPQPVDAEVVTYYSPENGYCSYSANDSVTVKVRSTGCITQTKLPLAYEVKTLPNGPTTTFWDTITDNINIGYEKVHKFSVDANLSGYNDYEIKTDVDDKGERFPISIINFECDRKKIHPTAKPVALCEWLVKTYSNEGDLVLDFTMGSGSTIVGCINTKRRYIGIEKDKTIFETAQNRINNIS